WHRLVRIDFFNGCKAADGKGLVARGILIVIKVAPVSRCRYYPVFSFGCRNTALFAAPTHHSGIGCKSTFENFSPANDLPAVFVQVFFNTPYEITLQLVFVLQFHFPHAFLTMLTFFPLCLWTFVSTYVDVFTRKKRHDLVEDILKEGKLFLFAGAVHIVEYSPRCRWFIGAAGTAKVWIRRE